MKRIGVFLLLLMTSAVWAGIPDPSAYKWGTMEVPENYARPDGRKVPIYWERLVSAKADAPAIILINGGPGMTHDSFHKQNQGGGYEKDYFHNLRTDFDVYYFDQRGTGNSGALSFNTLSQRDVTQYGMQNICRDLEELRVRIIKRNKIAVLGESYGGMVALNYAICYPNSVSRVIIHDSSPSNQYFTHLYANFSQMLEVQDRSVFPGIKADFLKALERLDAGTITMVGNQPLNRHGFLGMCLSFTYSFRGQTILAKMVNEMALNGQSKILNAILSAESGGGKSEITPTLMIVQCLEMLDEEVIAKLPSLQAFQPWTLGWAEEVLFQPRRAFRSELGLSGFARFNVIPTLARIRVPTLVVVGKYDYVCPPRYAQMIRKGIGSHCSLLEVDQSGHGAFIEHNEFTISRIHMFLLGVAGSIDSGPAAHVKTPEQLKARRFQNKEVIDSYIEGARHLRGLVKPF